MSGTLDSVPSFFEFLLSLYINSLMYLREENGFQLKKLKVQQSPSVLCEVLTRQTGCLPRRRCYAYRLRPRSLPDLPNRDKDGFVVSSNRGKTGKGLGATNILQTWRPLTGTCHPGGLRVLMAPFLPAVCICTGRRIRS